MRPKKLKKCMKLNWNFKRGGVLEKLPSMGGYGYFLELHIEANLTKEVSQHSECDE